MKTPLTGVGGYPGGMPMTQTLFPMRERRSHTWGWRIVREVGMYVSQ